jgi:hypothetical protein
MWSQKVLQILKIYDGVRHHRLKTIRAEYNVCPYPLRYSPNLSAEVRQPSDF